MFSESVLNAHEADASAVSLRDFRRALDLTKFFGSLLQGLPEPLQRTRGGNLRWHFLDIRHDRQNHQSLLSTSDSLFSAAAK